MIRLLELIKDLSFVCIEVISFLAFGSIVYVSSTLNNLIFKFVASMCHFSASSWGTFSKTAILAILMEITTIKLKIIFSSDIFMF